MFVCRRCSFSLPKLVEIGSWLRNYFLASRLVIQKKFLCIQTRVMLLLVENNRFDRVGV